MKAAASAELLEARRLLSAAFPKISPDVSDTGGIQSTIGLVADAAGNLYGTTFDGGANNQGSVFELAAGSGTITTLVSFNGSNGHGPRGLAVDAAGNLYGTIGVSGAGGSEGGAVFEVARGSSAVTTLASFSGALGGPAGPLIDAAGDIFGTTDFGASNDGTVFELKAGSSTLTTLVTFDLHGDNGAFVNSLVSDAAGNLYGTTEFGGSNGAGTVFEVTAGSRSFTTLASFDGTDGNEAAGLAIDAGGNLYGTTIQGGANNYGTVFELPAGSSNLTARSSFSASDGINPGGLVVDADGNLFGETSSLVFELPASESTAQALSSYTPAAAGQAQGLVLDATGTLYTATFGSGAAGNGANLLPAPAAPAQSSPTTAASTTVLDFSRTSEIQTEDAAGNLYGTTLYYGSVGAGSVFEIASGSSVVTSLASFDGTNGASPSGPDQSQTDQNSSAGLIVDGAGNLFGTTDSGGANNFGTVYEVAAGSGTVTALASFDAAQEGGVTGLLMDAAGNLYGTSNGKPADSDDGTAFELPAGSSTVTTLAAFDGSDGANPKGLVMDSAGNLYGAADNGGPNGSDDGTVFELAKGTRALTALALFNGSSGSHPTGIAVGPGGNLYGTTDTGGPLPSGTSSGYGTLFEVAAGSRTVTNLQTFDFATRGEGPSFLDLDSAGDLYVTTLGPPPAPGAIFELAAGSTTLTTLHTFDGSDGQYPSGLVVDAAGNVYCSTEGGGTQNAGTLVKVPAYKTAIGALLSATPVTSATASETVTANFTDPAGVNLASITASGLTATNPGGGPLDVSGVTLNPDTGNPASVTATYTVAAPGGQWAAADNGMYSLTLNRGAALDTANGTNPYATASFNVDLPPPNADPDFASGGNVNLGFTTEASAVQANGKVLLAGSEPEPAGGTEAVLERLNADGSIDTAFGAGGTIVDASTSDEEFDSVAVQNNGDIVVAGTSNGSLLVARYTTFGSPDGTFGNSGRVVTPVSGSTNATAYGLALGPTDGSIVVAGSAGGQFLADRFTSAGAADPAFNGGAPLLFGNASDSDLLGRVALQSNGDVVAAGSSAGSVAVARITAAGGLDPTFGSGGIVALTALAAPDLIAGQLDHTEGLAVDSAGNILVANHTTSGHFGTIRLTPAGVPDPTFGLAGLVTTVFGAADDADAISIDGSRILVSGTTTNAGITQIAIAAYTADGSLDTTYVEGGKEVFASGLATGGLTSSALHGGPPRPDAEGLAGLFIQLVGVFDPSNGGGLFVGASQNGGSPGSAIRRLNLTSSPTPTGTLSRGTLNASVTAALPPAIGGAKVKDSVVVTVSNPKTTSVNGPVTVTLYLSASPSSLTGATQLVALTKSLKLKPKQRAALRLKLSSFPNVPAGTYYLAAAVRAFDGTITDVVGPSVSIAAPLVKAVVSDVKPVPASAKPGKNAGLELTLTNSGNIAASGATLLTISATATTAGAVTQVIGTARLKVNLKPRAGKAYKIRFTLPPGLAAGSYDLTASLNVSVLGDSVASDGVSAAVTPLNVT